MTSGGKNFNHFLEIVQTREIAIKIEKTFLVRGRGSILEWAQYCSINSTRVDPALNSYLVVGFT